MAVSAAKVKAVCTSAEAELVRASRKPALERLTATELKRYVTRARKLANKWDNAGRKQVRSRSPQAGMTDRDANTALKAEIFRDALGSLSRQLAALEAAGATGGPQRGVRPSKSRRAASHRASRSDSRKEIAEQKRAMAAKTSKVAAKKVAADATAASAEAGAAAPPAKAAAGKKRSGAKKAASPKSAAAKSAAKKSNVGAAAGTTKAKQRKASTAAKKARLAASGLAGRFHGHVTARGRRAQAARDARN
jgi:hypothetical protein